MSVLWAEGSIETGEVPFEKTLEYSAAVRLPVVFSGV